MSRTTAGVLATSAGECETARPFVDCAPRHGTDSDRRQRMQISGVCAKAATAPSDCRTRPPPESERLAIAAWNAIVLCIPPRLAGTAGHGGVTYFVTSVPDRRVAVFVDYQNTYHRARELFGAPGDPPTVGHVHPDLLGDLLLTLGASGGSRRVLAGIGLYRGRPGIQSHQKLRLSFDRQTARWQSLPLAAP